MYYLSYYHHNCLCVGIWRQFWRSEQTVETYGWKKNFFRHGIFVRESRRNCCCFTLWQGCEFSML